VNPSSLEPHRLLESLLWTPSGGHVLLDLHLERMRRSAQAFGVPFARRALEDALRVHAATLSEPVKVRLLLQSNGQFEIQAVPLGGDLGRPGEPVRLGLSPVRVDADELWLRHKTTNRAVYEAARLSRPDCDDVLLQNQRGELTESSSSNLVVVMNAVSWTPSVGCGLLPGTLRQELLDSGQLKERILRPDDLATCDALYLINSVRGWRPAVLVGDNPAAG
jgi:para-aminobenzoate synthetase/4-amino-4-deoxychorismate lyase